MGTYRVLPSFASVLLLLFVLDNTAAGGICPASTQCLNDGVLHCEFFCGSNGKQYDLSCYCRCPRGYYGPTCNSTTCDTHSEPTTTTTPVPTTTTTTTTTRPTTRPTTPTTTEDTCDESLFGDQGSFTSPGYPGSYDNNENCTYTIQVSSGYRVLLRFTFFDVEYHPFCGYDGVTIRDGYNFSSPLIDTFCGSNISAPVLSSGNTLWVFFYSDSVVPRPGFVAIYEAVGPGYTLPPTTAAPTTSTTTELPCDESLLGDEGNFTSPGYPGYYGNNEYCIYTIEVSSGYRVLLRFIFFQLESHSSCGYDGVIIHDGYNSSNPLNVSYCGYSIPPPVLSSGSSLLVIFYSDGSVTRPGFVAVYEAVGPGYTLQPTNSTTTPPPSTTTELLCDEYLTTDSGTFNSPNYPSNYPNFALCTYIIEVSPGYIIAVEFTDFVLESCQYDRVEIRDGNNVSSPFLVEYCNSGIPTIVISSGNALWIQFTSDNIIGLRGFNASYTSAGSFPTPDPPEISTIGQLPFGAMDRGREAREERVRRDPRRRSKVNP